MKKVKECTICASRKRVCNSKIGLLCGKHYLQFNRYGIIKERTRYDPNEIVFDGNLIKLYLYNKDGNKIAEAVVDADKYEVVKDHKWCMDFNGYVKDSRGRYLHRVIVNKDNLYVDHINGNKLDNRLANLRLCSNADNLKNRVKLPSNNTSGILGVRFRSDRNKWYAEIQCDNTKINLGSYLSKEEAIKARREAEEIYFGKYKSKILNNEIDKT